MTFDSVFMSVQPAAEAPVIALVGPTASGKTGLSLALAHHFRGSILSADSRVVYRDMDIGTAKPSQEELAQVTHHLINLADPTETYSVARYVEEAEPVLTGYDIYPKNPLLVVGGTGFYLRALLQENFIPQVVTDVNLRKALEAEAKRLGPEAFHQALASLDPDRASKLHPHDTVRVVRARELLALTGQPIQNVLIRRPRPVLWIGLGMRDRGWLHQRIEQRVKQMLADGWLHEVENLIQRYGADAAALQITHGYPELSNVLAGKQSLTHATESIVIQVRQYARRQLTWFRRNPQIHWLYVDQSGLDEQVAEVVRLWEQFLITLQLQKD